MYETLPPTYPAILCRPSILTGRVCRAGSQIHWLCAQVHAHLAVFGLPTAYVWRVNQSLTGQSNESTSYVFPTTFHRESRHCLRSRTLRNPYRFATVVSASIGRGVSGGYRSHAPTGRRPTLLGLCYNHAVVFAHAGQSVLCLAGSTATTNLVADGRPADAYRAHRHLRLFYPDGYPVGASQLDGGLDRIAVEPALDAGQLRAQWAYVAQLAACADGFWLLLEHTSSHP